MKTDNELIAKFMGYKLSEDGYYLLPLDLPQFRNSDHGEWCSQHEVNFAERYWEISDTALDYNRSWDWLMPVVEKINGMFDLDFIVTIKKGNTSIVRISDNSTISDVLGEDSKNNTYKAVVEFIKWYNKQNT